MAVNDDSAKFRNQEESNAQQRAAILGFRYLDTRGVSDQAPLIPDVLSVADMYRLKAVPLQRGQDATAYIFGITSSTPQSGLDELRQRFGQQTVIDFLMISQPGFREYMQRYDPPKEVVYEDVKIAEAGDSDTLVEVSKTLESVKTDDILTYLIDQADQLQASDIHLENQIDNVRVRMRVDGALHPVAQISHEKYRVLQASIASRANISTAATEAQTGHMQQNASDDPQRIINMRIETVPTVFGQDAVIRLFNFDADLLSLDHIGVDAERRKQIDEIISHPRGMVLVVGPTGSGKSTTLYSMLNALNAPDRKILTLEDPVEMTIPGVSQIPVDTTKGDSFAEKLRAVLRLDPDIVMVGEIRDPDTARTAIQASITGHLVLSTFHASSSAAAFSRIIDMIGQNPIFANAIRLVMSQRLVRRLDDATKIPYTPDEATKRWIRESLGTLPPSREMPDIDNAQLYKPGKSDDAPFGYKGRIVLMEQLLVTDEIQQLIRGDFQSVSVRQIEEAACKGGMLTMLQDGILRAYAGETTLEEINRAL